MAINHTFLPPLFGIASVPDTLRQLALPKFAGLATPNPTATAETNWSASTLICVHIIPAIRGTTIYRSAESALSVLQAGKSLVRYNKMKWVLF
jgi:hypothetical protein